MKRVVIWVVAVGLFVGLLWMGWSFRAGNASPTDLDLIWVRVPNLELWMVLVISTGLGAALATLVVGFAWLRVRIVNRRYKKLIQKLEAELHQLRSLPLSGSESAAFDEDPELALAEQG